MLRFVGPFDPTNNPVHRFYHMQRQYGVGADGVPMGKWVAEGTSGGTTMGFYERAAIPVQWRLAEEFVLLDHYFQGIHGGSFANHLYLISATLATFSPTPPAGKGHFPPAPALLEVPAGGPSGPSGTKPLTPPPLHPLPPT